MAIYANSIPYLVTQNKRVALPKVGNGISDKIGYDNLVFLFTKNVDQSISIINNTENFYHDGRYYYYFYNQNYRGMIANRKYNIMNVSERKNIYERIKDKTVLHPHPFLTLDKSQNKNCYFDMSKYFEIYLYMTEKYSISKKMVIFWDYFKNIWFSPQTSIYRNKYVLIDADLYSNFSGKLADSISNPLFMLYYTLYKNFELISDLNIDFLIYCKTNVLKVNPSKCDKKSYSIYRTQIQRLLRNASIMDNMSEKDLDDEYQKDLLREKLQDRYNFVGNNNPDDTIITDITKKVPEDDKKNNETKDIQKKVNTKIDKKIDDVKKNVLDIIPNDKASSKEVTNLIQVQSEMELDEDREVIENIYKLMKTQKTPTAPVSSKRDEKLRNEQENITIEKMTLKELSKINAGKRLVPKKDVSLHIKNINPNMKSVKFTNLNKDYIENVYEKDIMDVFTDLNNKSSKFYVTGIDKKDSSDELNYKDTYSISLKDEHNKPHKITVDIPKFIDNKFLYLGGNKKIICRQNFFYPVVKTAPDTVQIVSNYNKMFIRRIGTKSISSVERISRIISSNDECNKYFETGNNGAVNRAYLTTIEYDEFSKILNKFKTNNCVIYFSQKDATEYADKHNINIPQDCIFIGTKNNQNIFLNVNTQFIVPQSDTDMNKSICDFIVEELPETLRNEFNKTRSTKKLMYNTVTIMSQTIPFIVLLLFWEGISSVFKKMDLKYYFSSSYPSHLKSNESVVRFKDSYVVYEDNISISLLMNGLKVLDTENYSIDEYNTNEPYIEYFKKVYGKVAILSAMSNYYDFMIDPITREVLQDINLPTDLIELCIYASNLLSDQNYTSENSQTLSRVRSIEIIPAMLYYEISNAFLEYKNSAGKKKLSIPKDAVIKNLLALQTVEDYSTLNPVVELEADRNISSKGYRGINVDRAYSLEKRYYDDSMVGVVAMTTSPDKNCGITRYLTMEPTITTTRGYLDLQYKDKKNLKDINLFSPNELLYPLGNTRDDSIRIAMADKQSKHVIPVKNSIPALISNGSDEIIKYNLSSDFIINADEDGTVIDYNEKSKVMIIKYQSGKCRAINLAPDIVKNGGGGFFLNNELITKLKVGDTFKKDDTLAWHKDFFKDDKFNGIRMNLGTFEKVAITSSYNTYNDSTVITHKLARDAESNMTFCKSIVVGKNSNVYDIRNVGEHVSIGDPLISFDTSFDDTDLNKLLSNLSDDNKKVLEENSTNIVKSKYAGKIVDIKIYSTVDIEELSESLQKIVKTYYNKINNKKKFVSQYDTESQSIVKCGMLLKDATSKVEPNIYGVIKGQKVQDSVLFEFYIEHGDIMGVGDKLAYFTALKSIIGEVIPEGYEPYSEFRPDEEVSTLIGPSAILARKVPSILLTVLGNKVIVELKRKLEEIYNS